MIDRTKSPAIHPIQSLILAQPKCLSFANGVPLYWLDDGADVAFKLEFHFKAGTLQGEKLIAIATNELLFSGTDNKRSSDIHQQLDILGGYVNFEVTQEDAVLTLYGLVENFIPLVELVMDTISNVTFPEEEIVRYVASKKQGFLIAQEKVGVLARKHFQSLIFHGTPMSKMTELADFDLINTSSLQTFYAKFYQNGMTKITLVGMLTAKQIQHLESLVSAWGKADFELPDYTYGLNPNETVLEKQDAMQTAIRIGRILFNRKDKDYKDFTILNTLLGGYFGSRLMKEIREERGYTYGISSGIAQTTQMGYFFISTEVKKEVRKEAIAAIKHEIEKLQTTLVTAEELALVKSYSMGQLLKGTDGPFAMLDRFMVLEHYNLSSTYYDELVNSIQSITPKRIQSLAKQYLKWEDMILVAVG